MIRKYNKKDLKRLLQIESESFPSSAYDRFTLICLSKFYRFLVYEKEELLGYIIFDPGNGHILSIAVDPSYRGEGVGTRLVEEVFKECERGWIEVRRSNKTAQTFYLSLGFETVGEIQNYYRDEDAYIMTRKRD